MAIIQSREKKKNSEKRKIRSVQSTPSLTEHIPTELCRSKYTRGGGKDGKDGLWGGDAVMQLTHECLSVPCSHDNSSNNQANSSPASQI